MDDPYRQVVVFADARPVLAHLVQERLEEAGIKAFLDHEDTWQVMGDLPGSIVSPPRVVVAAADEERARKIVDQFEEEGRSQR